jgi:glycosyltransferase involved in cell wall biosynthesis
MRILQVVPRYAPAWAFGGGVRITYELARRWVQHGHEVTVFTSDQRDARERFEETESLLDGIRVRRFRNWSHRLAARYSFLFFRPRGFARALKSVRGRFDVVHVAESRGPHNRWVGRHVIPQGVPVVWSAYGGLAEGEGVRRTYRRVYDQLFDTRSLVAGSAGLIAQTSHEADVYRQFGADPKRIHLIPLAVNWSDFETLPARGAFRARCGLDAKHKLVLFVGRVHRTKGLQVLIPAFARAARNHPDARLAIVGWDHGYLADARQAAARLGVADKVIFAGPLYGSERFLAYVDADVFALTPGVYEETSLAALEACASGVGCVITRQCEIPGLEAAGAGRMVDYDVEAVSAGLCEAMVDGVASAWGIRARRMVQTSFTTETVACRHELVFKNVIGSSMVDASPA